MVTTPTRPMTAEDVWALPEDDRGELIRGEFLPRAPVEPDHGDTTMAFGQYLRPWVRANAPGLVGAAVGFRLPGVENVLLAPDVAYVREDRLPPPGQRSGFLDLAPDLAVEVLSPSNTASEMNDKILLYLEAGTRLVWVADPRRQTVAVHTPDRVARTLIVGDTLDGGDVLPGFALPLADLFA